MTIAPWRWAMAATSIGSGISVKPVIVKFEGWTRRTALARPSASGASKSAARVRFVVPTSISFAPARRMISGIRTPPPISTSSPRETTIPDRPARPTARASAAALLFVTNASSAPVSATRCSSAVRTRAPRRPVSRSSSRSRYRPARSAAACATATAHGARPRFVWTMTPVALMTGIGPASSNDSSRETTSRPSSSVERGRSSAASRARSESTTSRAALTTASTLGGRGRSVGFDVIGPPWRERVGVEPTAPRRAPRHWF